MFFSINLLRDLFPQKDTKELEEILQVFEKIINENGIVLYGHYTGEEAINFSSKWRSGITHQGIVIGLQEYSIFEHNAKFKKRDSGEYPENIMKETIKDLRDKLQQKLGEGNPWTKKE